MNIRSNINSNLMYHPQQSKYGYIQPLVHHNIYDDEATIVLGNDSCTIREDRDMQMTTIDQEMTMIDQETICLQQGRPIMRDHSQSFLPAFSETTIDLRHEEGGGGIPLDDEATIEFRTHPTLQNGTTTISPMENIHEYNHNMNNNSCEIQDVHVSSAVQKLRQKIEHQAISRREVIASQCPKFGELRRVALTDPLKRGRYSYKFQDGLAYKQVENSRNHYQNQMMEIQMEIERLQHERYGHHGQQIHTLTHMYGQVHEQLQHTSNTLKELRTERTRHIQESHAVLMEDESPFVNRPILANRYVLMHLLGRGGFCEVWKVFDLLEERVCAAKLHKHYSAARSEYAIHHQLHHPNIVEIYGDLIIGDGPFEGYYVIIMEEVDSNLLTYLKLNVRLSEAESQTIISQIMNALAYLNQSNIEGECIVHYDLKPENILMTKCGQIKLTDFGLSRYHQKSVRPNGVNGTYWYLSPECFTPCFDITSKIDVWAVGVIFYQLMFGCRPYGEKMNQKDILQQNIILNAPPVEFPNDPTISSESKDFIRRCLQHNITRPSIRELCGMQ